MSRQTVLLIFVATLTGHLREVLIIYGSVLLHELAHLYMCHRKKIPTEYMAIYPYGMELRLKKLTSPNEQILISAAGPMVNLALFFLGLCLMQAGIRSRYISFLVSGNLVLFCFNLMPCVPLDGSEILRSVISSRKGIIYSYSAIGRLSGKISFIILLCACLLAAYGENVSLLIIFIIIRQGMSAKKSEQLLAAKQILNGEITSGPKTKVIFSRDSQNAYSFVKYISFDYTLIILRKTKPPLTQRELIRTIRKNPHIEIDEI